MERQALDMQLKSNKPYHILISGASGIVGYGILRSLKDSGCYLIGTTIYEESPANCFSDEVLKPPMTVDDQYMPWLLETINKKRVDMIIPAIEADMSAWNKHRQLLEATGACVLLNNTDLIELCLDKWKFYQKLKEEGVRYSIESSLETEFHRFETPFLLKPRCSFGSKGIVKVDSEEVFNQHKPDIGQNLMIQEFVGTADEEYTASAFFDRDSKLRASIVLRRKLSQQGFTEIAEVVFSDELIHVILELAEILKPVGPTNFQFRKHHGIWKLLEINPRISSSTSIRKAFGYNESQMCVDYFLMGKEITQPEIKRGKAIRYTEDFVTYDCNNI